MLNYRPYVRHATRNYVGRHQRGLFDLGGEILNSLFGVATGKQLQAIHNMAIHATSNNARAFEAWQQHPDQLSSFMTISNQRLDNLVDIIQTQQHMVTQMHAKTARLALDLAVFCTLVTYAIVNITNFITALNEVDDIRMAIVTFAFTSRHHRTHIYPY